MAERWSRHTFRDHVALDKLAQVNSGVETAGDKV
jgi:hypothetical protein